MSNAESGTWWCIRVGAGVGGAVWIWFNVAMLHWLSNGFRHILGHRFWITKLPHWFWYLATLGDPSFPLTLIQRGSDALYCDIHECACVLTSSHGVRLLDFIVARHGWAYRSCEPCTLLIVVIHKPYTHSRIALTTEAQDLWKCLEQILNKSLTKPPKSMQHANVQMPLQLIS